MKELINDMMALENGITSKIIHPAKNSMTDVAKEKNMQPDSVKKMLEENRINIAEINEPDPKKWQSIAKWGLFAFLLTIIGYTLITYLPLDKISGSIKALHIDSRTFLLMLFTGFIAQMADGSLGMGYGTISTTLLLSYGVNPAIVSSRVHSARVFSSGVSAFSHHRIGNINKKLFRTLAVPGMIGAIIGASLAFWGQKYSSWVRIPLSVYTCYLGYFIIRKSFKKNKTKEKVKNAGWLASIGGFLDSFAGGGWGILVTSTLMSKRRSPRYIIGSVCLAEFFVVFTSSIIFFLLLKYFPILDVAGLIIGGIIAAPIAARLAGKLPSKLMFIIIGVFVILTSINTLLKGLLQVWR